MCGINGFINFTNNYIGNESFKIISKMNDLIIHRGPDDDGLFVQDNVALGMRRLSIIDLETGKQPIFNECRSMVIVFNGEIYNYRTLRDDLLTKGHIFCTASDTEVVLHCFEEYGTEAFNKLKGMFSLAIYDLNQRKLTLARDRAGEKPLYYYNNNGILLFASELKSIISSGLIKKEIDMKALNQYLQLTYIPAPLTILKNVYKLLPGYYMEVDFNKEVSRQYWDVIYQDNDLIQDYDKCKKRLRSTLFNAVEECMVADVSLGTFLSGGIDSTIITGIASKIANKPLDTFTIGYKDKQYDESDRAKLSSELHSTNHHTFYLNYEDALPELNRIINNIDEPFADSSYIPIYMVSKYASKLVKTILTGDAGDELFGGYSKYLIGYYSVLYNKNPKLIRDIIKKFVYSLPDNTSLTRKLRKVIDNSGYDVFTQRKNLMCLSFKNDEMLLLLNENYAEENVLDIIEEYYNAQALTRDELSQALYTDFKIVLEGDMLPKVDRASMLNSLETRVPMLHKDVIELAAQIPSQFKIDSRNTKIILKDTFSDLIPKELLVASKRGFSVPVGNWFRKELKNDLVKELEKERIQEQGIFNYVYIEKIIDEHFTMKRNRSSELWTLYIFQKWYKKYIE